MRLSKRVEELEAKVTVLEGDLATCKNLQSLVRVLKDEIFALQDDLREKDKKLQSLMEKFEDKEETIAAQADEIRRWNEGLNNIMNYSLEVARGDKK